MDLTRGDIIICSLKGDFGKPRPAVIIQSDVFNQTHSSITLCPITSHLIDAPLFRILLSPSKENGLKINSQVMVDKITTLSKEKIQKLIGQISFDQLNELNTAIKTWLGI